MENWLVELATPDGNSPNLASRAKISQQVGRLVRSRIVDAASRARLEKDLGAMETFETLPLISVAATKQLADIIRRLDGVEDVILDRPTGSVVAGKKA